MNYVDLKQTAVTQGKPLVDLASIGTVIATLLDQMPHVAALLSVVWMIIRILETDSVQRLLGRRRRRKGD